MNQKNRTVESLLRWTPRVGIVVVAILFVFVAQVGAQEVAPTPAKEVSPVAEGTEAAAASVSTSVNGIEMHSANLDIHSAFRQLNSQVTVKRNIVVSRGVTGTVSLDLYGVTFDEAVSAITRGAGLVAQREGSFLYVYTQEEFAKIRKANERVITEVFHLSYIRAKDAKDIITSSSLLSEIGTIGMTPEARGGLYDYSSEGTATLEVGGDDYANSEILVVTDYEANIKGVATVLDEMDVRPQQVLIETTILRAAVTDDNALGVDLRILCGTSSYSTMPTSDLGGMTGEPSTNTFSSTQGMAASTFAAGIPSGPGTVQEFGSMTFGIIAENIAVFIRAVESITDVSVVANPKLLVLNKQQGTVHVGQKIGYVGMTTQTETANTTDVKFLNIGTLLHVRPFIGKDGYIRMEIQPKNSDGRLVGGLPQEDVTQVTSNMMVRDGQTVVIGGLYSDSVSRGRSQTPLIGNVPGLGTLFRNSRDRGVRQEVIILITPHIIKTVDDEHEAKALQDAINRIRIGSRRGIVWWSTSRLGDHYLMDARQKLSAGDVDGALWAVDKTLSMQPLRSEALYLKNQLRPQASWAGKSKFTNAHNMVSQMILAEKDGQGQVPPRWNHVFVEQMHARHAAEEKRRQEEKEKAIQEQKKKLEPAPPVETPVAPVPATAPVVETLVAPVPVEAPAVEIPEAPAPAEVLVVETLVAPVPVEAPVVDIPIAPAPAEAPAPAPAPAVPSPEKLLEYKELIPEAKAQPAPSDAPAELLEPVVVETPDDEDA